MIKKSNKTVSYDKDMFFAIRTTKDLKEKVEEKAKIDGLYVQQVITFLLTSWLKGDITIDVNVTQHVKKGKRL